jgi:hypothetical protein
MKNVLTLVAITAALLGQASIAQATSHAAPADAKMTAKEDKSGAHAGKAASGAAHSGKAAHSAKAASAAAAASAAKK